MTRANYAQHMLTARRGLSRRMVGRGALLDELHALLQNPPTADGPSVAMITGEAGIGKTRLLRELLREKPHGVTVVSGQARETEAGRSFALLRDTVEEHLDPRAGLHDELERWRHPLGHLLEPLIVVEDHPRDGHEHKQEEFARAGVALLRHLTDPGPALLAFEDLHWADAESLEVIGRLARSDAPALVVGTFRSEEYDRRHPLAKLLAELEREGTVSHLAVEGLSRDELAELIEEVTRRLGDGVGSVHELFTPRELEVVKLVARGYTNSDIAERLFITRKTAATHISNILSKTGFERRTQVAIWAVQESIVERVEQQ